eukprot:2027123-Amphidinium_carterae.2
MMLEALTFIACSVYKTLVGRLSFASDPSRCTQRLCTPWHSAMGGSYHDRLFRYSPEHCSHGHHSYGVDDCRHYIATSCCSEWHATASEAGPRTFANEPQRSSKGLSRRFVDLST